LLFVFAAAYLIEAPIWQPWEPAAVFGAIMDEDWRPWGVLGIIGVGVLVVMLMRALARGKRQAWILSTALLTLALMGALLEHASWRSTVLLVALLIVVAATAPLFSRRSDLRASIRGYAALALGGWLTWGQSTLRYLWRAGSAPAAPFSVRFVFISLRLSVYALLAYGVWQLVRPTLVARMNSRDQRNERDEAGMVVKRHGELSTAHFALGTDKRYFWSHSRQSLIAYRVAHGVALVLSDPIGPTDERDGILDAFLACCQRQDWRVALYQIGPQTQQWCRRRGLFTVKIGEDAIVDVEQFTLQGKAGAAVRHAVARARRGGVRVRIFHNEALPADIFTGMRHISTAWLRRQETTSEYGFSMGRFPADWSPELVTAVALGLGDEPQAFVTWTPTYVPQGWALDVMRRPANAQPGAMESLLAASIAWAREQGCARVSLGLVPLAGLGGGADCRIAASEAPTCDARRGARPLLPTFPVRHLERGVERGACYLHRRGLLLSSYHSLYFFKDKFQPTWEPRYLALSEVSALPQALTALSKSMGVGWTAMARDAWNGWRST
jgi:phosphatidylglycerol lysyltransferase